MAKTIFFRALRYFVISIFALFVTTIVGVYGTRVIALGFASMSGLTSDATLPAIVTYWLLPVVFVNGLLFIATFYMIRGVSRQTRKLLDKYERDKEIDRLLEKENAANATKKKKSKKK